MGYRSKRLQDVARGLRLSKELLERDRWPRDRLERFQQERLATLAHHAAERSAFWRERIPSGRPKPAELPVLTKSELMERFDDAVTDPRLRLDDLLEHLANAQGDELYLGQYRAMSTSGSSGRKGVFVYDRPGWSGVLAMFLRRSDWLGIKPSLPRVRLALIGGSSATHMSRRGAQTFDVGIHRLLSLSATQPLGELVARLNDFQPNHMNLYPSTAALLCEEQLAGRLRLGLDGIATSSETLSRELRARIERAFGIVPRDFFATTEGLWGHECPEGSMHLFDDVCIVENVDEDGRPVAPGEVGSRLLVTNLFNRVQPLFRLEIPDLVAFEPEPCTCGRSLLRLRSVEGRAEGVLRLGGVAVHPLEFGVVTADPDVREFQVVQEGDSLRLRVALRDGADAAPARLRNELSARLAELGVPAPEVRVETVDALDRTDGGKLKMVVAAS